MTTPVKLYVYDLSNGLARQLSTQFIGRQINGIWHTSVVAFGKEIFYGRGICITSPGKSHHGVPQQVIDLGETALDEETFNEYLEGIREHYTADKYHLLDFNCNSFTNDCIGFLTGGSIPSWISDLPADFLSTPFGAALRPTIDAMFNGQRNGAPTPPRITAPAPDARPATSMLQEAVSRAMSSSTPTPASLSATSSLTGQIHVCTNPSSFHSLLKTHRAVVAFFTSAGCQPCRMIEPLFEDLARQKGAQGVAFTKVDMGVGLGNSVASEWNVRVTPTFIFFLDGKKINEMKGADAPELRTQVDLLLYQAFPPHPHTAISLPTIQTLSLNPILFSQVPALDAVIAKFVSFIDTAPSWPSSGQDRVRVKELLGKTIIPYLKARFATTKQAQKASSSLASIPPAALNNWAQSTKPLIIALPIAELFPLVDMWRLAVLDPTVGSFLSTMAIGSDSENPLPAFLAKGIDAVSAPSPPNPRNYILTLLRLLSNAFSCTPLAHRLVREWRASLTTFLVTTLLHEDAAVRTAAASLSFNVAALLQRGRVENVRNQVGIEDDASADGEWEVEMVSAVVEALDREKEIEDVVHRLTASLAFFLRLSPSYETNVGPLLEVLQARAVLKGKLNKGGCGPNGVTKKEVRKLIEEVADKLCP